MHFCLDAAPLAAWNVQLLPVRPVRWHATHIPGLSVLQHGLL
jgi:hypothetical protein